MGCYLCNKKSVVKQQKGREICADCFCRLIEKRIRKYARVNKIFGKNDSIFVVGKLAEYFVRQIIGKRPVKIFSRAKVDSVFIKKNKINLVVVSDTLDDEINMFLEKVVNNKKKGKDKSVKLLSCITDEEAQMFAKIKKIKFVPKKKNKDIMKFVNELSAKHTHARFSLIKNIKDLE